MDFSRIRNLKILYVINRTVWVWGISICHKDEFGGRVVYTISHQLKSCIEWCMKICRVATKIVARKIDFFFNVIGSKIRMNPCAPITEHQNRYSSKSLAFWNFFYFLNSLTKRFHQTFPTLTFHWVRSIKRKDVMYMIRETDWLMLWYFIEFDKLHAILCTNFLAS